MSATPSSPGFWESAKVQVHRTGAATVDQFDERQKQIQAVRVLAKHDALDLLDMLFGPISGPTTMSACEGCVFCEGQCGAAERIEVTIHHDPQYRFTPWVTRIKFPPPQQLLEVGSSFSTVEEALAWVRVNIGRTT